MNISFFFGFTCWKHMYTQMVTRRQTFYLKQKEIEMKNVFRPFGQKQKCIVLNFVQYRIKVVNHDSSLTTVFFSRYNFERQKCCTSDHWKYSSKNFNKTRQFWIPPK